MRIGSIKRKTKETDISVTLQLDGNGNSNVDTGIGFFDHMLTLFAKHANMDLSIYAKGDLDVDDHHTIEDIGIALGQAFQQAIGDKIGIARYGSFRVCMDEALAQVDLDISGRSYLVFHADFTRDMVGMMACEMVKEFFYAFSSNAFITLHINLLYGDNDHHKIEAIFKAFAHALKQAVTIEGDSLLSTKGVL